MPDVTYNVTSLAEGRQFMIIFELACFTCKTQSFVLDLVLCMKF